MKRACLTCAKTAAFAIFLIAATPSPPPLQSLIDAHVKALGGMEAIRAITSVIERGTYHEGTLNIDTFTAQRRPFYRVIGDPRVDPLGEIHEGYDGSAWEYYPDPRIVVRTVGAAADAARHAAAFDDPLVQYGSAADALAMGPQITLFGKPEYTVHVVLYDGFAEDLYVNPTTFMIDGEKRIVPMHAFGKRLNTVDVLSDYRPEGGVQRAHRFREMNRDTGATLTESSVATVEINPSLPLAMFSPPVWERTPLELMIQRIYDERDEARAVMATYRDFAPLVDVRAPATGDAVDFVGYQCLKMGHSDTTIALLKANVNDHPGSARAHFGLGRAYQAGNEVTGAREQYREALRIEPGYSRAADALKSLGSP